jgi:hypothetical protein
MQDKTLTISIIHVSKFLPIDTQTKEDAEV